MGEEDGHGAEGKLDLDMLLTGVEEAADFVKATNVDALAIAIGTSHGATNLLKSLQAKSCVLIALKKSMSVFQILI
jgi:fructose/tagatose bisphosphate aldolase